MNIKSTPPASVLFVDDEEKARKYFALAMANDFDVKTAGSASEAMDILGRHAGQIAIIVSDQRMPEKSGVELLKSVREYYPHVVRLLTTAYTDLDDAIEAINRGEILRYIQKPWDINTLKSELKQAMNYFLLRHERDSLLEEKLSVRQHMVQIERVSQLLLVGEAIPCLRFTGHAVRRFVNQLVANKALSAGEPALADLPRLDLWDQTLAEATRMQQFVKSLTDELAGHLPFNTAFNTHLDFPALQRLLEMSAGENAAAVEVRMREHPDNSTFGINVDEPLFRLMLAKLFALLYTAGSNLHRPAAMIHLEAAGSPSAGALRITLEMPGTDLNSLHEMLTGPVTSNIPPPYADMLIAFLACLHHGGALEISAAAGHSSIVLDLPSNPLLATLEPDTPYWHENILATFEPDID